MKPTIRLQCRSCGGTLNADDDLRLLHCPFCGAKELLEDSDAVAAEKIRQQTEFRKWEREDRQREEQRRERYRTGKAGTAALVLAVLCAAALTGSLADIRGFASVLRAFCLLTQTAAFLLSYLIRREVLKPPERFQTKTIKLPALLMAVGFGLFAPSLALTAA